MPVAEDDLGGTVEQVLGSAWPRERRRASRRLVRSTLLRAAGGVLGFWGLAVALRIVGKPIPWVFYPGIAALTAARPCSRPGTPITCVTTAEARQQVGRWARP